MQYYKGLLKLIIDLQSLKWLGSMILIGDRKKHIYI